MKNLTILILIILCQQSFANEIQLIKAPKVDTRVELVSIVFRMAGNREYNSTKFKFYTDKIEGHFSPYKNHEIIGFAKELRDKKSISYEAVVNMAVILDDHLNPLIDFTTSVPERWDKDDAVKFTVLLKKFYKDAKCKKFFKENEKFFQEISNRFTPVYKTLDLNWFQTFYGNTVDENFNLIISPGCGDQNYGTSYHLPNAKKEVFAIVGTWRTDESGMPVYEKDEYLPFIVHEFNHPFVNPLLAKYKATFEESGKEIYNAVENKMSIQQAYGNPGIMLNEALVRASVILYLTDHGAKESDVQVMMKNEVNRGFIWIKVLADKLKSYENQRNVYPTLESYIPVLSDTYKTLVIKIDALRPKVESITEFANNDTSVSSKIKTITVNFDRPLAGIDYPVDLGSKGKYEFPKFNRITYTNDNKSVVMEVQLMPDKEYQFILTGRRFITKQGVGLKPYEVHFKTSK